PTLPGGRRNALCSHRPAAPRRAPRRGLKTSGGAPGLGVSPTRGKNVHSLDGLSRACRTACSLLTPARRRRGKTLTPEGARPMRRLAKCLVLLTWSFLGCSDEIT